MRKLFLIFFFVILCFSFTSVSFAENDTNILIDEKYNNIDDIQLELERYTSVLDNGVVFFDENLAKNSGADDFIIQSGRVINNMNQDSFSRNARAKFPVWGRWCGPGHSGPGAPISLLDRFCQSHDNCYASKGYFNCYCDYLLTSRIRASYWYFGLYERSVALGVLTFFSMAPCKR